MDVHIITEMWQKTLHCEWWLACTEEDNTSHTTQSVYGIKNGGYRYWCLCSSLVILGQLELAKFLLMQDKISFSVH